MREAQALHALGAEQAQPQAHSERQGRIALAVTKDGDMPAQQQQTRVITVELPPQPQYCAASDGADPHEGRHTEAERGHSAEPFAAKADEPYMEMRDRRPTAQPGAGQGCQMKTELSKKRKRVEHDQKPRKQLATAAASTGRPRQTPSRAVSKGRGRSQPSQQAKPSSQQPKPALEKGKALPGRRVKKHHRLAKKMAARTGKTEKATSAPLAVCIAKKVTTRQQKPRKPQATPRKLMLGGKKAQASPQAPR